MRLFVDVPDDQESFEFFRDLKERLKVRFEQIDIWMTTFLVDIL